MSLFGVLVCLSGIIGFYINKISYNDVKIDTCLLSIFLFTIIISIAMIKTHHNARFYENGIYLPIRPPIDIPEITFPLPYLFSKNPIIRWIHKLSYVEITRIAIVNDFFIVFCYKKKDDKKEHYEGYYIDHFDIDIEKFRTLVGEKTTIKNIDVDTMVEAGRIIRDIKEYGLCVFNDPRYN